MITYSYIDKDGDPCSVILEKEQGRYTFKWRYKHFSDITGKLKWNGGRTLHFKKIKGLRNWLINSQGIEEEIADKLLERLVEL